MGDSPIFPTLRAKVAHRNSSRLRLASFTGIFLILSLGVAACQPITGSQAQGLSTMALPGDGPGKNVPAVQVTTSPARPVYAPGELVDYVAQTGDTLPALAAHFNTTVHEIIEANSFIPDNATTLPPGMPMKIPIYYAPFWGPANQIIPDSLFINGPAQIGVNLPYFVSGYPGWVKNYQSWADDANRSGVEIIELVAENFSLSPRLLLALLEYQAGALTNPELPVDGEAYLLGVKDWQRKGFYLQLIWAANTLNNGYYGWRAGKLITFEHLDGRVERPDPWQNAASVALQYYFSRLFDSESYARAVSPDGFEKTYKSLFGDPWQAVEPHIPGSLEQPPLALPFTYGLTWAFTGGPHTGFGDGDPLAAIDFAPGSSQHGCYATDEWVTAVAPGIIARSDAAVVVLDLDKDGDEHTGWVIFYFHVATEGRATTGQVLQTGDPIGHPSCEGGRATGTHIHIARKYNGEWIQAAGILPFNLGGWVVQAGDQPYQGYLVRNARRIIACDCADQGSQLQAEVK